jgi:DNA-binding MarR family transcriptional regulator
MAVRWLDPAEEEAWRAYRRMRTLLDLQLSRDLAEYGVSEADYDVLSTLSEQADRSMRVSELAQWMHWTQTRLSHHLTRMQSRGLVTRETTSEDGRGARITLTDDGWQLLRAAAPGHVTSVREHFIDLMSQTQLKSLTTIARRVVDHLSD